MKRLRRILLIIGLVAAGLVITAAPAHADICKDAPPPVSPRNGLPGLLSSPPKNIPAQAPDPFADPTVPISDVYGYGWDWSNYDLGCGNDFLRDPVAVTATGSANIGLDLLGGTLAFVGTLEDMSKTSSLDWLSTALGSVTQSLKEPILVAWFPLATILLAVIIVFRSRKASFADAAKAIGVFAAALVMMLFALTAPTKASDLADNAVGVVAQSTGAAFSTSPTDSIVRDSAYRVWLAGNFDDPNSELAKRLGPKLLSATRYTWSDWQRINADPDARKSIDEAKAAEFKSIAKEIEDTDPASYEQFTGRGDTRNSVVALGVIVAVASSLFVATAAMMVLLARVMMQVAVFIVPLAAVLGILPSYHSLLRKVWDLFTAGIVATAKFTLAAGVMAVVLGALQAAAMSTPARLFWIVVATIAGMVITHPFKTFKTMVPGLNPNHSYLKDLGGFASSVVKQYALPAAGAYAGTKAGVAAAAGPTPAPSASGSAQAQSMAPLPAPTWSPPGLPPGSPGTVTVTVPSSATAAPPTPFAAGSIPPPTPGPSPAVGTSTVPTRAALPPGTPTAPDASAPGAAAAPTSPTPSPSMPPAPTRPAGDGGVVEPTAVLMPSGLDHYHPGDAKPFVYIPSNELELADDGTEHERIVYHSDMSDQES